MLGPAQCVKDRQGFVRSSSFSQHVPYVLDLILRRAADGGDQLKAIAAIVLAHQLEYATRMAQGFIAHRMTVVIVFILPARFVVSATLGVVAGKQPILEAKLGADDQAGIGIGKYVVALVLITFDQVIDQPPEAGDIRDRKSTRLNSSHVAISYAVFCLE